MTWNFSQSNLKEVVARFKKLGFSKETISVGLGEIHLAHNQDFNLRVKISKSLPFKPAFENGKRVWVWDSNNPSAHKKISVFAETYRIGGVK